MVLNNAYAKDLSPSAKVYLMTVGPYYSDFASMWGHVALLIQDDVNDIDIIYNYGGAAYGGNFMLKLVSGNLDFYLDVGQTYAQDLKTYERAKRDVDLYELNLSSKEKNKLYNFLIENLKEENKYYRYEFYKKNCATFTLNAIKKSIDGDIVYKNTTNDITYRDICDDKFKYFPWTDFFIKLVAGTNNDKKLDLEGIFFVPKNMVDNLKTAVVKNAKNSKPFFKSHKVVFDFPDREYVYLFKNTPLFPISILFGIEIILFAFSYYKKKNMFKYYDYLWFIVAAILSLFLLFTMLFTEYIVTKWNLNLLWLSPLFVLVLFFKGDNKTKLFKAINISIGFVILGFAVLPQTFYLANLLLAAVLLLKTIKYGFLKEKFQG